MKNIIIVFLISWCFIGCTDRNISVQPINPANVFKNVGESENIDVVKTHPGPANVIVPGNARIDTTVSNEAIIVDSQKESTEIIPTKRLQDIFLSQVGVRELTGGNDGRQVEMYLRSVGLGKGFAWCAAFVRWNFDQVNIRTSITGWSPTAHNKKNIIFMNRKFASEPVAGDVVCFYYPNLGRIGHTGFYYRRISSVTYESVEGNTNGYGSREGDGVYIKYRPYNSTYSITSWYNGNRSK